MPIRPEQKALYPPPSEWKQIRTEILERAGHACEACAAPDGEEVFRPSKSREWRREPMEGWSLVRVVLTIAHLDHDPSNRDRGNLKAWCQRCHLGYDAQEHRRNAAVTRARKALEKRLARGEQPLPL